MGLDLKILPLTDTLGNCREVLIFDRDDGLFDIIEKLQQESGYDISRKGIWPPFSEDPITHDAYGNRIKSVTALELHNAIKDYITDSRLNKAIMAYLAAIFEDTIICLLWS